MDKRIPLLGIAGTNGSGKDTLGDWLAENHGYWFFPFTELFREECRKRGIPVTRENTRSVSTQWRRESGLATLIDRSLELYKKNGEDFKGIVLASLRNPYEADRIHELGGKVIWLDSDPRIRYERIQANAVHRNRAGEDDKTFEQFLAEQEEEMHPPAGADEAVLNIAAVKDRADIVLINNTTPDDLYRRVVAVLKNL